jgi:hypothetical protein
MLIKFTNEAQRQSICKHTPGIHPEYTQKQKDNTENNKNDKNKKNDKKTTKTPYMGLI